MRLKTNGDRVLVISDLQIPFHHKDSFAFLEAVKRTFGCDKVVSIGDEVDQYGLSRYNKDPDAMNAGAELELTKEYLQELYEIFPEAKACLSNHMDRVFKRALDAGIPRGYMRSIKEFMEAPSGWNWSRYWTIGGVRYEHGDACGGQRAHRILAESNRTSTVIGHHHAFGGVDYISNGEEMIFGMNVGCLIDIDSVAFHYAKSARNKPTLGCGVVIGGVPAFIPMLLDRKKRWTGGGL
jgi:hypothetical protein